MTRTHLIDGPKCPNCGHREQLVTFAPIFGWGLPDGAADITGRACPKCAWSQEEPDA